MKKNEHIKTLIQILKEGLHEREEIIAVSLLAALTGQNTFLLGPPGTAKSLIARRLASVFQDRAYFEYLMHRFSTPEEIFGPVSISELKKDNFERKTYGFLPRANFAFLDEIWKSSPAILNTLLTLINEKIFRNGTQTEEAPLKSLISASNETPPENQGLEALYDRFAVRLFVSPMEDRKNFETLLQEKEVKSKAKVHEEHQITNQQLKEWKEEITEIKLSQETLDVIQEIKIQFADKKNEKLKVYVSDRRWRNIATFLKGAAFFCGRKETNLSDALLLRHCLWTTRENRDAVLKIVENAVKNNGYALGRDLAEFDKEKETLEKEINKELLYTENVYKEMKKGSKTFLEIKTKTFRRSGYGYDHHNKKFENLYIDKQFFKTDKDFHPQDENGNEEKQITCNFKNTGTCTLHYHNNYEDLKFTPKVLFHKGDKKEKVNHRLIQALKEEVRNLISKSEKMIEEVESHLEKFQKELETPFVPKQQQKIALQSVTSLLENLQLRRKDCDRVMSLTKE